MFHFTRKRLDSFNKMHLSKLIRSSHSYFHITFLIRSFFFENSYVIFGTVTFSAKNDFLKPPFLIFFGWKKAFSIVFVREATFVIKRQDLSSDICYYLVESDICYQICLLSVTIIVIMFEYIKHYTYFDNKCRLLSFDNKFRFFSFDNKCRFLKMITNVV